MVSLVPGRTSAPPPAALFACRTLHPALGRPVAPIAASFHPRCFLLSLFTASSN